MPQIDSQVVAGFLSLLLTMLSVLCGIVGYYVKRNAKATDVATVERIARIVVKATEQIADTLHWAPKDKLKSAQGDMRDIAEAHGLKLTDEQYRTFIESAVKELKDLNAQITQPTAPLPVEANVTIAKPAEQADPQPEQPPVAKKGRTKAAPKAAAS